MTLYDAPQVFVRNKYITNCRFLENLIRVTSKMSETHSESTVASVASQTFDNPSSLQNFEREDKVIEGLLSGL